MGKIFYILLTAWFCCALSATEYKSCELNIETVKGQEKAASELLYHWEKIAGSKVSSAPGALKVVIGRQPPKKRAPKKGESNWFSPKAPSTSGETPTAAATVLSLQCTIFWKSTAESVSIT